MLAFHNDPAIKEKYITRVRDHMAADHFVQEFGPYYDKNTGRGCAVGCTLNLRVLDECFLHRQYESQLGLPEDLAYLEEAIFEDSSPTYAATWPLRFLNAIPVGADISESMDKWRSDWLLVNRNGRYGTPELYASMGDALLKYLSALPVPETTSIAEIEAIKQTLPSETELGIQVPAPIPSLIYKEIKQ